MLVLCHAGTLGYHVRQFMNPWFHRLRNGKPWLAALWEEKSACTRYVKSHPHTHTHIILYNCIIEFSLTLILFCRNNTQINKLINFCLQLHSASVHFISAKHTTPFKKNVYDINFRLVSFHFYTCCHVSVGYLSSLIYYMTG